jgi:hypothetical protein
LQRFGDDDGAVDGVAFLIRGQQDRRASRDVPDCAATKASAAVTKAASEAFMSAAPRPYSMPSPMHRQERVAVPLFERSARDDVGVAGKTEQWAAIAAASPEVGDTAAIDELAAGSRSRFEAAG